MPEQLWLCAPRTSLHYGQLHTALHTQVLSYTSYTFWFQTAQEPKCEQSDGDAVGKIMEYNIHTDTDTAGTRTRTHARTHT